jgi:hypothetical protein
MRTNELRKSIPEITERMLFRHLRDMTGWDSGTSSGARLTPASAVLAHAVRTDVGLGVGCSLFVGQRLFETRSFHLNLAERASARFHTELCSKRALAIWHQMLVVRSGICVNPVRLPGVAAVSGERLLRADFRRETGQNMKRTRMLRP